MMLFTLHMCEIGFLDIFLFTITYFLVYFLHKTKLMAKDRNDKTNLPMDYAIKSYKVRVVNENGLTDIMSKDDAIAKAKALGKNLVQIAFNPSIFPGSICKIIDYAKFKYDEKKRQKEQAKRLRASKAELKEIKFTIRIDDNDRKIKIQHIKEFLENGDLVKITIFLAKREMSRIEYAKDIMKQILSQLDGIAKIEGNPTFEGRALSCTVKSTK